MTKCLQSYKERVVSPDRHNPFPGNPLQETVSLKSKLGLLNGCQLNLFPRASSKKGFFGDNIGICS